jgi:hypothetical protein
MPKTVTFACDCDDAVVSVEVQHAEAPAGGAAGGFQFQQKATRTLALEPGAYRLAYRAAGAARGALTLGVTKGARMARVSRALGPDGRASGVRALIVASLLCGLAASPCLAQDAPRSPRDNAKSTARDVMDILPAAGRVSTGTVALSVEANATARRGALALVLASPHRDRVTATITLAGPLSSDTGSAQPLSAAGLSNTATVDVAVNAFLWRGRADAAAAQAFCRDRLGRDDCDDTDFTDARDRRRLLSLLGADVSPVFVSVSAGTGRDQFRYLMPDTFTQGAARHQAYTGSVVLGRIGPRTGFVGASYEYQYGWQQNHAAREICVPLDVAGVLECRTAPVGGPAASRRHLVSVESRRFVGGRHVGIAPKVSWNARTGRASVAVPVYFITDGHTRLSGGIKFNWNSHTRDMTVTLFIGPLFRLRP